MTVSVKDTHPLELGGRTYLFRTPDCYDPARARRLLGRQRVRRPGPAEFRVAALAGVAALAEAVGDAAEGVRQRELLEDWYRLIEPLREDDIDEPDFEARAAELARLEAERGEALAAIFPQVAAIEATLERHWPPYAELRADRVYWDEVSRIEIVRLLLVAIDGQAVVREAGETGLLTSVAYQAIPAGDRLALGTFALGLLAPDETQRKN